jgi:hypothetical protein
MYELMLGLRSNRLLTSWHITSSFWGTPLATLDRKASISTCVGVEGAAAGQAVQ